MTLGALVPRLSGMQGVNDLAMIVRNRGWALAMCLESRPFAIRQRSLSQRFWAFDCENLSSCLSRICLEVIIENMGIYLRKNRHLSEKFWAFPEEIWTVSGYLGI